MGRNNRRKGPSGLQRPIDGPLPMVCDEYGAPLDEPVDLRTAPWNHRLLCRHWRQPVEVEPGVTVYASAYLDRPHDPEIEWPDIGVYLSERWAEEAPLSSFGWAGPVVGPHAQIVILPCPDGGSPLYLEETERVLTYALNSARAGCRVEIGCHAGHGRTGVALAALMILGGLDPEKAMLRVWDEYCEYAIESLAQERYLLDLSRQVGKEKR